MSEARPKRRVLIIDDDRRSREELRARLSEAGHDVEGISSEAGLTPDILELLRPELVLFDLNTGGDRRDLSVQVVLETRAHMGFRLVLVGAGDPEALRPAAASLGADAWASKDGLLADPDQALGPPPLPRREPSPPAALLSMIQEEIGRTGYTPGPSEPTYEVEVTLFSEHNFFLARTPTGQQVGLFVATALPPLVASKVRLGVSLPRWPRFVTRGEVLWVRERPVLGGRLPPGAGVRMSDLTEEDKAAVRAFLTERAPFGYTGQ